MIPSAFCRRSGELVAAGYKDITLLGQNVNSYGNDLDLDYHFPDLLEDIDKIPGEYLIRFMSSHPKDATNHLFDVMSKCSHVAKQLHLPFQSGNDRVLKEMNRRYTREKYLEEIRYAKSVMPGLVLTSDVIIGFPGETEAEAMDTVSLVEEVGFDALFTFIYSPGPAQRRQPCRTPPLVPKSRSGSISSWKSRMPIPPSSTPPMWARPSGCWWTARVTMRTSPLPPALRATGWCG